VTFTGFMFEDRLLPGVKKDPSFLHVAGQSRGRFSRRIINEWLSHPEWPLLNVTGSKLRNASPAANVRVFGGFIDDGDLRRLQNESSFQICTSRYEGFGHSFWEALSCGAVVLAANAPPMDESLRDDVGIVVPATVTRRKMGLVRLCDVSRADLRSSIEVALSTTTERMSLLSSRARNVALEMSGAACNRIAREITGELS
jgi:glycosyltransferase involved in cell wall biosynthesis